MEPNWTKNIPSSTVCNFFYMFFVVYAVIFVVYETTMTYTRRYF